MRHRPNPIRIDGDVAYMDILNKRGEVVTTALISASDVEKVRSLRRRWKAIWIKESQHYRIVSTFKEDGRWRTLYLYRFLVGAPPGMQVDHINRDPLDNRRENLRLASPSQNQQNQVGAHRQSLSGIRGAHYNKRRGNFRARIILSENGVRRSKHLGDFDSPEEAGAAYEEARRKYFPYAPQ